MARHAALIGCVAILLLGCKGSGRNTEPVDPFFGRVRIDPPRTGAIGNSAVDPSYAPTLRPNPLRVSPGVLPNNALPTGQPSGGAAGWVPVTPGLTSGIRAGVAGNEGLGAGEPRTIRQPAPDVAPQSNGAGQGSQGWATAAVPGDRIAIPPAARELGFGNSGGVMSVIGQPQPVGMAGIPATNSVASDMAWAGVRSSAATAGAAAAPAEISGGITPAAVPGAPRLPGGLSPGILPGGLAPSPGSPGALADRRLAPPGTLRTPDRFASGASSPLASSPTMSRPTVNLAAQRERIIRTLDPAGRAAPQQLPQPVDPAAVAPPAAPRAATTGNSNGSMAAGLPGASPPLGTAGARAPAHGTRFPNRVVDITELPITPSAK